jgi:ribose transport system permease protein
MSTPVSNDTTTTIAVTETRKGRRTDRVRTLVPVATLVLLYVAAVLIAPGYLQSAQIGGLLQQAAILGVIAIGQTLVLLVGGIDLSVGAVATFANLITGAMLAGSDANLAMAIPVALGVGLAIGLVNGAIITFLKVPDLVATLATMTAVLGLGYIVTNGSPRGSSSPALNAFVTERFLGVLSGAVLLWVILGAITVVMLTRTAAGRRIYAVGLSREASRFAAISSTRVVLALYAVSGVTAAAAGVLLTGYTGSSFLGSGDMYQLASIAAVVLGGVSILGGSGGYLGAAVGVLITTLLRSVLQVVGIPAAGQNLAYGAVILIMLIAFTAQRSRDRTTGT